MATNDIRPAVEEQIESTLEKGELNIIDFIIMYYIVLFLYLKLLMLTSNK